MSQAAISCNNDRIKYLNNSAAAGMSNSITQNWTDQAIRCYYNSCDCNKCTISKGKYSFDCQMASVVKILYKELGPPDKERIWKSIIKVS
ncbi:MAG: hypothetical protein AB7V50_03925 [Vampirovibrionia bacterium]